MPIMLEYNRKQVDAETGEPLKVFVYPHEITTIMQGDDGPEYTVLRLRGGGRGIVVARSYRDVLNDLDRFNDVSESSAS